jgi:pimeloyl-ACP methyl ester carboxylesterase
VDRISGLGIQHLEAVSDHAVHNWIGVTMTARSATRQSTTVVVVLALLSAMCSLAALPAPAVATPARTCPEPSVAKPDISKLRPGTRPVVLVHGWTGSPLSVTAERLDQALNPTPGNGRWQMYQFDYHIWGKQWAAVPQISTCLADYIATLSAVHSKAGGDGKVYVVGHSMGGLAARFAVSPQWGGKSVASLIGGVVTLDTPHSGTPWGNTPAGLLKEAFSFSAGIPNPFADASRCLAVHHAGSDMQKGCDPPPYLSKQIPLTQIAGSLTVRRSLFGIHLYDITMGGDTIVPLDSEAGYLGSAAGGRGVTLGMKVRTRRIDCAMALDRVFGYAVTLGAARLNPILGRLVARLDDDSAAMDAIGNQTIDPALLQFMALANLASGCSHAKITEDPDAIAATADALRAAAALTSTTTVKMEVSPVTSAGDLKSGFTVKATVGGATCLAVSEAIGAGYRCFAEHGVYDPCWAETTNPSQPAVLCMFEPWEHQVTRLLSAQPLEPLPPNTPDTDAFPWGLTLTGGQQCRAAQGAHDQFNGRTVDYSCSGELYVLRGLDRRQPLWQAQTARYTGGYSLGPEMTITRAWYGQPLPS